MYIMREYKCYHHFVINKHHFISREMKVTKVRDHPPYRDRARDHTTRAGCAKGKARISSCAEQGSFVRQPNGDTSGLIIIIH